MIDLFLTLAEGSCSAKDGEAALIARAQRDPSEFAAIYRQYVGPVFYYVLTKVGSRSDAEDLTAQVFLEAWESLPTYHHKGYFTAWLFTIVRHRVADFHRRRKPEPSLAQAQEMDPQAVDPLSQIIHAEHLQYLSDLLTKLSENKRELLRLRFAAGLNFTEIDALQGRKESAIKMSYYRLLARLQSQMEAGYAETEI